MAKRDPESALLKDARLRATFLLALAYRYGKDPAGVRSWLEKAREFRNSTADPKLQELMAKLDAWLREQEGDAQQ